jgi:pilus assembly protein FimV
MRAKPLVIWGLLAGVFTLPATTLALGLGKLTVDSSLGQPLSAHVELTAAQKDELDSLSAKVADPSVYRDNNVQYPATLSRARVVVEQTPNGPPQLKVTTAQPVNDPYLDLIVEVNWATGRVVRNYTFLLDPPGTGETQAAPSANVRTAPAARAARAEPAPSAPPVSAAPKGGAAETYTVRRGDTLSKIARTYKPENVNLEQMLVALFRSNESAFDTRNMNRLRTGQILSIPPAEQAAAITPSEAQQVVRVQAADWRAYRDRVAAAAPATEGGAGRQAAGGKITTAVEDKAAPAQPGKDQLKVSREAGKGAAGAGAGAAQAEESTAKEKALREANSRIADLEKTLKDMQRAVELKSQAMAELQKQAEANKAKAAEAPKGAPTQIAQAPVPAPSAPGVAPAPAAPAAVTPPSAAPAPAPKAAEVKPPEAKAPETKAPEAKAPEAKAPDAKTEPKAAETKAPEPKESAPAAESKPAAPVKAKAPPKPAPSFFDDLLGNTPMWAIIAGVLGIIALIAGLFAARRRTATKFEDSIISGTDIKTNTVFGSTGGGVVNTGDNSLSSDFSREGLGNIDTDEVDPIAEAEVYLAYGRDAQAEEILKEALKKDAQRQEIYLKLLEIHAQHNKPSAFETVATELYSVSGGQGEVWQKAMALGRQLDPANPLFTDAGGTPSVATAEATGTEDAVPSEPDTPPPASAHVYSLPTEPRAEAKPAREIDFSLDDDISLSPTSGHMPDVKTPAAILAGAAQEVAKSTRAPEPAAAKPAAPTPDESMTLPPQVLFEPESIPKFDLDFNLEETSRPGPTMTPVPPMPAPPKTSVPKEAEPALAAVASAPPAPQLARPAAAIELDKLDLSFDPQRSTFEDPTPSVLDGQWHDAATKLDLAKAYEEMGDVEGAREILQEVLHEGDDQQKAEAQTLLTKLA